MVFVYMMANVSPLSQAIVLEHVNYLRELDAKGELILCGPFADYPGGMVVIECETREDAIIRAERDPFIASGAKSYELRTLDVANQANDYGLA